MIRLIRNEIIKFSKLKNITCTFILILTIFIIIFINKDNDVDTVKDTIFSLIPFIGVMICVLCGNIVSNEFQNGTIRMYLTKPFKRWKILLSKLIFIYLLIVYYIIITIITYFLLIVFYKHELVNISYIKEILIHFIPVFFMGGLSFSFSTIFNSTSLSVGLSIIVYFASPLVSQILFGLEYNLIQYTFLPYVDFSIFKDINFINVMKNELGVNLTIFKSALILFINNLFIILLTFNLFIKKDIKN